MKVYIGPYKNWFGPYQLAEKLCFWAKPEKDEYGFPKKPDWVHNFGEWLAHGNVEPEQEVGTVSSWDRDRPTTWLYKFLLWIDSHKKRKTRIRIDKWDTWGMDSTLALMILPMLKQLKETKHGSPPVDMNDVPVHMRTHTTEDYDDQLTFDFYHNDGDVEHYQYNVHDRWNWVMGEMIFAFETVVTDNDWRSQFETGVMDIQWIKLENGMSQMTYGPNHTHKTDDAAVEAYQARIDNGFRLFGRYYNALWD